MSFKNIAPLDFSIADNRRAFQGALDTVQSKIAAKSLVGRPIIAGRELQTEIEYSRVDPSFPEVTIGKTYFASYAECDQAIASLENVAEEWANLPMKHRAQQLRVVGAAIEKRRLDLAALIVREAGKPWKEADADVIEAIDFCNYYAELAEELGSPRKTAEVIGEENYYSYRPRGLAVVIAPWNFPLAIACGMAAAALVTGNVTILKPAEQTSLIAYELAKIIVDSGMKGFAFLPGYGEDIGAYLVNSPKTQLIAFTGSKQVGLGILQQTATISPMQYHLKQVVLELGGKNAIIVDEDADLDDAVKGVVHSAFGFSGQKCSACSRVIVVGDTYEPFIKRLIGAARDVIVGPAADSASVIGPVIDSESQSRLIRAIDELQKSHQLAFRGPDAAPGYFVPATIFRDVATDSVLWREELFGPVLACAPAKTFAEALKMANDCQYALTGGLFSRSPQNIAAAKRGFDVGNLYINRGCTGAIVCRQPFGGHKLSGIGSKAGGPDYLRQFMHPLTISENIVRRGYSPDLG